MAKSQFHAVDPNPQVLGFAEAALEFDAVISRFVDAAQINSARAMIQLRQWSRNSGSTKRLAISLPMVVVSSLEQGDVSFFFIWKRLSFDELDNVF